MVHYRGRIHIAASHTTIKYNSILFPITSYINYLYAQLHHRNYHHKTPFPMFTLVNDQSLKRQSNLGHLPVDIFGTVIGESPDCLLLSGTVVGENPDYVCWAKIGRTCRSNVLLKLRGPVMKTYFDWPMWSIGLDHIQKKSPLVPKLFTMFTWHVGQQKDERIQRISSY